MNDGPTVTVGPSAFETVVEQFGWSFNDEGVLIHDDGQPVESYSGETVTFDEFGGIVPKDGEPTPIRDNFAEMVDWVSSNDSRGEPDE